MPVNELPYRHDEVEPYYNVKPVDDAMVDAAAGALDGVKGWFVLEVHKAQVAYCKDRNDAFLLKQALIRLRTTAR